MNLKSKQNKLFNCQRRISVLEFLWTVKKIQEMNVWKSLNIWSLKFKENVSLIRISETIEMTMKNNIARIIHKLTQWLASPDKTSLWNRSRSPHKKLQMRLSQTFWKNITDKTMLICSIWKSPDRLLLKICLTFHWMIFRRNHLKT